MVSVPVLSELIADVNPSVSTDGRSLTMAFCLASSRLPIESTTWTTVGKASGMAEMARATALMKSASLACPRWIPRANMITMVRPAAPMIQSVSVFIWRVSGVSSRTVVVSMLAIRPTWVSPPVPVTIMTALPCVTGVCMNAMLVWSPGPSSSASRVAASLDAGTLSPVSAASSICSELAETMRPSAGTWSPAASNTTSPTTSCEASTRVSDPSRRTRAVSFIIDLSAFIALCAFPS